MKRMIILGFIFGFLAGALLINFGRTDEKDRLNARCVELARQLRNANLENKELKQIRLQEVRNNSKILEQNNKKTELIKAIADLAFGNKYNYNNEKSILDKIKELISDYQSQN